MTTEMNENSKTSLQTVNENLGGLEDVSLRTGENFVSNMSQLEKGAKEPECYGKRKSSEVELSELEQLGPLSNDNENLPVEEPKSKKARRGRPASAKKCSSTLKQRTRAKNKRWSDSDSQHSDHDMYKGIISSVPLKKRERTPRKAASKVKYTFDTDEEEIDEKNLRSFLSKRKYVEREQGNDDIRKIIEAEREIKKATEILSEMGQLGLKMDHPSNEFKDDTHTHMVPNVSNASFYNELKDDGAPMKSTKNVSCGNVPRKSSSAEVNSEVSKMVKKLSSSSIISDSSSDSSFSLFIDLKIPAAEVTDNPRIQETNVVSDQSKTQVDESEKPSDPRIRRRALILKSKIEEQPTEIFPGNDVVEVKSHMSNVSDDDANCFVCNVSSTVSSLQSSCISPRFSSDDSSNSNF